MLFQRNSSEAQNADEWRINQDVYDAEYPLHQNTLKQLRENKLFKPLWEKQNLEKYCHLISLNADLRKQIAERFDVLMKAVKKWAKEAPKAFKEADNICAYGILMETQY